MRPTSNNHAQSDFVKDQLFLTPEEVSRKLRVSAEQVRNLIRQGRISAVNVGTGMKRPRYRIRQEAVEDFINSPSPRKRSGNKKKFRRPPPVQDLFPELR